MNVNEIITGYYFETSITYLQMTVPTRASIYRRWLVGKPNVFLLHKIIVETWTYAKALFMPESLCSYPFFISWKAIFQSRENIC